MHKLLPNEPNADGIIFYKKMLGDYYRYLAEFQLSSVSRESSVTCANRYYTEATELAEQELVNSHPIRLGLALNYAVFKHEIMLQPGKACQIAKSAFDGALSELDQLSHDSYRDATLIMQLLRDNLVMWSGTENGEKKEK